MTSRLRWSWPRARYGTGEPGFPRLPYLLSRSSEITDIRSYSGDVDERTRRCIRVAEEFLAQGREVVTLPEFDLHEHALAGQMIYWRKPAGE